MNVGDDITSGEREALDRLEHSFNELLSHDPQKPVRNRRIALMVGVAFASVLLMVGLASKLGGLAITEARASLPEVALRQDAPAPNRFVKSESTVTTLVRRVSGARAPRGVRPGGFYNVRVRRWSWLSMTQPGLVRTAMTAHGPGDDTTRLTSSQVRPLPGFRIGGRVYRFEEIKALAAKPNVLRARIERKAQQAPARFRSQTAWQYFLEPLKAISPPLPSSLRAELIRGLESVPGVGAPSHIQDPSGRPGVALRLKSEGLLHRAVFDGDSAQLLYADTIVGTRGAGPFASSRPGQVLGSYSLLSTQIVDTVPK